MTINRTGDAKAVTLSDRSNFLRCALRILVVPALSISEIDRIMGVLEREECRTRFHQQLSEYLWEHHTEELVVPGRDDLDLAVERIAMAFAMLDEDDQCAPTSPLLWLDVSQPLTSGDRRLR